MKAICVYRRQYQHRWIEAFAQGLKRHGVDVGIERHAAPCDLLVLWGIRDEDGIRAQRKADGEICILERGYIDDRFKFCSVSFGGRLNGRAEFRGPLQDGSRWETQFSHLMQPWRKRDGYALLIGQIATDKSLAGVDIMKWYKRTAATLREQGWEVFFRPHPGEEQRAERTKVEGVQKLKGSLQEALDGTGLVVTWNSNTGVEGVLSGVPAVSCNDGSMAWPVTAHTPGEVITPDRTEWAHAIAWKQFSMPEIASGFAAEATGLCQS